MCRGCRFGALHCEQVSQYKLSITEFCAVMATTSYKPPTLECTRHIVRYRQLESGTDLLPCGLGRQGMSVIVSEVSVGSGPHDVHVSAMAAHCKTDFRS